MRNGAKHRYATALLLLLPFALAAQAVHDPKLHHRGDASTTDHPVVVKPGKTTVIPEDASGEYMLGKPGEFIEITLQFGDLSGYVSRQGDGESDEGTPLAFFFDQTTLHDQELNFTTRQVHGVWYSFKGTILRGGGKTREEDGYYVLVGDLIEHNAVNKTEVRRSVALKSGRYLG